MAVKPRRLGTARASGPAMNCSSARASGVSPSRITAKGLVIGSCVFSGKAPCHAIVTTSAGAGTLRVRDPNVEATMLEIRDLTRRFGAKAAVDGITLSIATG